ncbi:MAG: hypothetical protein IPM45_04335 [Acidimicrobiales bacterium]|nr:hypothetical protein [Acidimicrobiales bacterium]
MLLVLVAGTTDVGARLAAAAALLTPRAGNAQVVSVSVQPGAIPQPDSPTTVPVVVEPGPASPGS